MPSSADDKIIDAENETLLRKRGAHCGLNSPGSPYFGSPASRMGTGLCDNNREDRGHFKPTIMLSNEKLPFHVKLWKMFSFP